MASDTVRLDVSDVNVAVGTSQDVVVTFADETTPGEMLLVEAGSVLLLDGTCTVLSAGFTRELLVPLVAETLGVTNEVWVDDSSKVCPGGKPGGVGDMELVDTVPLDIGEVVLEVVVSAPPTVTANTIKLTSVPQATVGDIISSAPPAVSEKTLTCSTDLSRPLARRTQMT